MWGQGILHQFLGAWIQSRHGKKQFHGGSASDRIRMSATVDAVVKVGVRWPCGPFPNYVERLLRLRTEQMTAERRLHLLRYCRDGPIITAVLFMATSELMNPRIRVLHGFRKSRSPRQGAFYAGFAPDQILMMWMQLHRWACRGDAVVY